MSGQKWTLPTLRLVVEVTVTPEQTKVRVGDEIRNAGFYAEVSSRTVVQEMVRKEIEADDEDLAKFYTSHFRFLHRNLEKIIYAAIYAASRAAGAKAEKRVGLPVHITNEAELLASEFEADLKRMLEVRRGAPKRLDKNRLEQIIRDAAGRINNPQRITLAGIAETIKKHNLHQKRVTADSLGKLLKRHGIDWLALRKELQKRT